MTAAIRARPARSAILSLLLTAILCATAGTAHAEPSTRFVRLVFLRGQGAHDCPGAERFEAAVSDRLQRFPFSEVAGELLVVLIERAAAGFQGRLFLRDQAGTGTGERQLRLATCGELVDSLAVAAGVLLAPPARPAPPAAAAPVAAEPEAEGKPQTEVGPPPLAAAAPESAPGEMIPSAVDLPPETTLASAPAPRPTTPAWQLAVGPLVAVDPTGQGAPGAGLSLAAGRLWPRLALLGESRILLPQRRSQGRGSVAAVTVLGGVSPCWRYGASLLCAPLNAGLVRAWASGYDDSRSTWRPTAAVGLRYGYQLGLGRVRLRPNLWAEAPLLRWRFTVDEQTVLRQGRYSVGAGLELLGHFL